VTKRYKSPIGIMFLMLELASIILMALTIGIVFHSATHTLLLAVGVTLFTVLAMVMVQIPDTWVGTIIAVLIAAAITSPIFYYVFQVLGWPVVGFMCIVFVYGYARIWRKEAEKT
jgi:hypothetical protein